MYPFLFKSCSLLFSRGGHVYFILLVSIFLTILAPKIARADPPDPTTSLNQIFGEPDVFIQNFETQTKDKADEVISFMVAAFGFRLVIKSFM